MIFEKIREKLYEYYNRYDDIAFIEMNTNGHTLDFEYANGKKYSMGEAIKIISQVEAEYNNGWIPCSERLPEEKGDYLVTCNDGKVRVWWFVVGNDFKCWRQGIHNLEPIAWQPLPQPPKGE